MPRNKTQTTHDLKPQFFQTLVITLISFIAKFANRTANISMQSEKLVVLYIKMKKTPYYRYLNLSQGYLEILLPFA